MLNTFYWSLKAGIACRQASYSGIEPGIDQSCHELDNWWLEEGKLWHKGNTKSAGNEAVSIKIKEQFPNGDIINL